MADKALVENLIKVMQYEYKAYSAVLEIGIKKTDCLVSNDVEGISDITEEEKKVAEKTSQLSKAREEIVRQICNELGEDYKTFTMSKLEEKVDEPYKTQLKDVGKKLSEVVKKLSDRNDINRKLIENALKYIDFNIQLLSSPQPEATTYGKTGDEVSSKMKRSMIDFKY
ncbi:MAG: flagellar protein FlgN [Clostridiaceae bacterium]|nr:flagellar protein FlgN [Clostridiaceae bacterium]